MPFKTKYQQWVSFLLPCQQAQLNSDLSGMYRMIPLKWGAFASDAGYVGKSLLRDQARTQSIRIALASCLDQPPALGQIDE